MIHFKSSDVIIINITIYFITGYIISIKSVSQTLPAPTFIPLLVLSIGGLYLAIRSFGGKKYSLVSESLKPLYVYIYALLLILVISNINALRPAYSISRVILSVSVLALYIAIFLQALRAIEDSGMRKGKILSGGLFILMLALIIGQVIIPEWGVGLARIRMSGGSNPNQVAFLAFFGIFWAHYSSLRIGKWQRTETLLYIVSIIVLLWSLSRSVILTLIILYIIYFSFMITKNLAIILRGYISKRLLKIVSISMIVLVIVFPLVPNVLDLIGVILDLQVLERRLEGESGLASRLGAWKQLWPYFTEAPLTGKAGWWNSTNLLPESGTPGTAASPHNLYVRLLSESGLAGFIAVLALPVLSGLACLKRVLSTEVESKRFRIASFMTGSIMSILIGQMFEDRYLVGIAGIGNGIITFIIVSAIITCSKS